jgi:uncharacterized damage-inducible protein DinB
MTPEEASTLFAYNDWASARLLACAAGLPKEEWTRDLGGAFPALLGLVAHVVGAERVWLLRWKGESPSGRPAWMDDPSPELLGAALREVERDRAEFLGTLTRADLERPVRYTLLNGSGGTLPLATLLQHTVNHSTYHRGQIASMLRRLGTSPPATDLLVFALEQQGARGPAPSGSAP